MGRSRYTAARTLRPASRPQRWKPLAAIAAVALAGGGVAWANDGAPAPMTRSDTAPVNAPETAGSDAIRLVDPATITTVPVARPASPVGSSIPGDAVVKVPLSHTLAEGMTGPEVRRVQQRLKDLAFDPGPVDGVYGDFTVQAVWAFQKLVLGVAADEVTTDITPSLWDALQDDVSIVPRRADLSATHVEVYLPQQVLIVFSDDRPVLIAHISSGELAAPGTDFTKGAAWCSEVTISPGEIGNRDGTEPIKDGRCGNAETPGGTYRFYRKVDGRRESALGGMYDPVYFNYGIAVHGATEIPTYPASHGCIRINRYLSPIFAALITRASGTEKNPRGDDIYVWNGTAEPETYGPRTGWFDTPWKEWREEHATTTTTSTTPTTIPASQP